MKIRKFTFVISTIALLLIIWGMTPPTINLAVKILLTVLTPLLCLIITNYPSHAARTITSGVKHFFATCGDIIQATIGLPILAVDKFIDWTCETSLDAVTIRRDAIISRCYCTSAERLAAHRPIYRICRCIDFTAVCGSIAFISAHGLLYYYRNVPGSIILGLFNAICLFAIFSIIMATSISVTTDNTRVINDVKTILTSTFPTVGTIALLAQAIFSIMQLAVTIVVVLTNFEITTGFFYQPFFNVNLRFIEFQLSPLQAIIAASALLCLIGYGYICSAINDFANLSEPTI